MKTLDADQTPLDPFESAIMSAALSVVIQKAFAFGFQGCEAERNAIATFANFAARKSIDQHHDTPCPEHGVAAVVVRGLVFALVRSIVDIAKREPDPSKAAHDLYHAAMHETKTLLEGTVNAKSPTHDVAGGVQ